MNRSLKWNEVAGEVRAEWRSIFNGNIGMADVEAACPVCSHATLHRWYFLEKKRPMTMRDMAYSGPGRLWEWCSTCLSFEYYPDGYVPEWWVPPFAVARESLRYDPGPIEAARNAVAG